jgi:dephospho-CoA kinase
MPTYAIGLPGGSGSGKSTVAAMLQQLDAGIIDADTLVHELIAPSGAAVEALRREFGAEAIAADGGLDRAWMRARAFGDADVRRRLEAILHPQVRAAAEQRAVSLSTLVPYIVFVIPLLVESGDWRSRVQRILVVDCVEEVQISRVAARPGMDKTTARAILHTQAKRQSRLAIADDVLYNEAPRADIESRVALLHRHYVQWAREPVLRNSL